MRCKIVQVPFFAAGDIAAGEEIIYNYGDFAIGSGWAKFGM